MYNAPPPQRRPWFGPRPSGSGMSPQTWQGWMVVLGLSLGLVIIALVVIVLIVVLAR